MPIYEYRCADCGHELEALQSVGARPRVKCPACGVKKLRKKLSAAAFHLKGQGWYKTDFRDQDKKKSAADNAASGNAPEDAAQSGSAGGGEKSGGAERKKTSGDASASGSDPSSPSA